MAFPLSSQLFFNISMGIYLVSFLCYLIFFASQHKDLGFLATIVLSIGLILHSTGLVLRWIETHQTGYGYVPLSNMYESLIFFSWTIVFIYLILEFKYRQRIIGALVTPFAFLAIALTSIIPGIDAKITPLVPALQSNWLTIHVTTCFFGYASFAVSFGISILYLVRDRKEGETGGLSKWLPSTLVLDEINYKSIVIGFPMLTLGIVTGAAWANYAWGTYWSWDPKETWSLITWFMYAAFLHARITRDWRGRKAAILSIVGFGAVLFTYFGVNYLLSGLHSYL
ncbi:MAG: c-type cytochrome biogenesis protein CcsB [Deltaproteobacteria bacterium RBG_16_47_11]|nr:MAG: c-type cytochrome biogenesis protein CcsB [Deltaproteobacteria bacterium RBG_16_47_11]